MLKKTKKINNIAQVLRSSPHTYTGIPSLSEAVHVSLLADLSQQIKAAQTSKTEDEEVQTVTVLKNGKAEPLDQQNTTETDYGHVVFLEAADSSSDSDANSNIALPNAPKKQYPDLPQRSGTTKLSKLSLPMKAKPNRTHELNELLGYDRPEIIDPKNKDEEREVKLRAKSRWGPEC